MKILGIGFIALMGTFLVVMAFMQLCIWAYHMGWNPPINKELFFGGVSAVFVWFYHWCWKKSL